MKRAVGKLLENNRAWATSQVKAKPEFFKSLVKQQTPKFLWIGCADSRVPANEIVGLAPGELFVHRNVANVVHQTDFNLLSVLSYALEALNVEVTNISVSMWCVRCAPCAVSFFFPSELLRVFPLSC